MAVVAAPGTSAISPQVTAVPVTLANIRPGVAGAPVKPAPLFAGQVAKPTYGYAS